MEYSRFISSKSQESASDFINNGSPNRTDDGSFGLEGEKVRAIYEDIVFNGGGNEMGNTHTHIFTNNTSCSKFFSKDSCVKMNKNDTSNIAKGKAKDSSENINLKKLQNEILRYCQTCDLVNISKILNRHQHFDLNYKDSFGWTPLMCAACSGSEEIVLLLLQHNADKTLKESTRKTAYDIANKCGNIKICQMLHTFEMPESFTEKQISSSKNSFETNSDAKRATKCELCDCVYFNKADHNRSIVHNFNSSLQCGPKPTLYHLPDSNVGFQIMVKNGWNREKGLGPKDNEGLKFPVKTILKKDRKGIGMKSSSKPKITHSTHEIDKSSSSTLCKFKRKKCRKTVKHSIEKQLKEDRKFYRHYRQEFS